MTSADLARAIGRVQDLNCPRDLTRLEAELRALGDREADVVARQAALKRRRINREN